MEPTIVQNGALFALQHRPAKGNHRRFSDLAKMQPKRLFFRLPFDRINWLTSSFLIGTAVLTLTALPLYLWFFGLAWVPMERMARSTRRLFDCGCGAYCCSSTLHLFD